MYVCRESGLSGWSEAASSLFASRLAVLIVVLKFQKAGREKGRNHTCPTVSNARNSLYFQMPTEDNQDNPNTLQHELNTRVKAKANKEIERDRERRTSSQSRQARHTDSKWRLIIREEMVPIDSRHDADACALKEFLQPSRDPQGRTSTSSLNSSAVSPSADVGGRVMTIKRISAAPYTFGRRSLFVHRSVSVSATCRRNRSTC